MARNTRATTCTKDKKELLNRMAKALGKDITEIVDAGIDLVWKLNKKQILRIERSQAKV